MIIAIFAISMYVQRTHKLRTSIHEDMMRDWLRTVLFISAFSPALLTLAYVRYSSHGMSMAVWQLLIVGIIGSCLPSMIISLVQRKGEIFHLVIKKVEPNDFMLLSFITSYFLPLIGNGIGLTFNAIAILLFVTAFLLWLMNYVPVHPLLQVLHFKFYKVETPLGMVYTLISKREITDPRSIKNVKKISSTMLIEVRHV